LAAGKADRGRLVRRYASWWRRRYEAVQLYVQLAESIDNELAKRVLMDVADEISTCREFLALKELAPRREPLRREPWKCRK
jgi:hypothetical protein